MPKRGKMFAGITRQVVISDETHQFSVRSHSTKTSTLGNWQMRSSVVSSTRRQGESQRTNGMGHPHLLPHATGPPNPPVSRPRQTSRMLVETGAVDTACSTPCAPQGKQSAMDLRNNDMRCSRRCWIRVRP